MTRSPLTPSPRARRGRLMLVGSSPALDQVAGQLPKPPVTVSNLFEAIGEITIAPAGQPIKAVLVASSFARDLTPQGVEALRRLDPAVLVLLVAEHDEDVSQLPVQAFDECLFAPIDGARLFRAIEEAPAPPHADDAGDEAPAPPGPTDDDDDMVAALGGPPSDEPAPADWVPEPHPAGYAPRETGAALGDTDLVEAALHDPNGVAPVALELARQQTGWDDLSLQGPDEPAPTGTCATADVRYGDAHFGRLSTSHAGPVELEPWAQWLARWLALDRSYRDCRIQAVKDELTGAWNRRFFRTFLHECIVAARERRRPVTVMVFDIDDFKRYNDEFGHQAGDVILVETVRLLNSVIRRGDRVCRIGGDEFAVIFADPEGPREVGSRHPVRVEEIAKRFQDQICRMRFPKLGIAAPGTLSISGGLATFPWDGDDPDALLRHADQLAMQSKRTGKNVITFGPSAASRCDPTAFEPGPEGER